MVEATYRRCPECGSYPTIVKVKGSLFDVGCSKCGRIIPSIKSAERCKIAWERMCNRVENELIEKENKEKKSNAKSKRKKC